MGDDGALAVGARARLEGHVQVAAALPAWRHRMRGRVGHTGRRWTTTVEAMWAGEVGPACCPRSRA